MAKHLESESHPKLYGLHHFPRHRDTGKLFPGFGPGLYFPESLSAAPELEDPTQEIELPPMHEYLNFLQNSLAQRALERTVEI